MLFNCENVALRVVRQPPIHASATNPRNRSAAIGRPRTHGAGLAARCGSTHDRRAALGTCRPDSVRTGYARGMNDQVTAPRKRHRVEVRGTPQQDALIRQAAGLGDTTVTAFLLD